MRAVRMALALIPALIAFTALAHEPAKNTLPIDPLVKQWWQRYLSIPNAVYFELGETPEACGLGQRGKVWFLSSRSGGDEPVTRHCTIPRGRKLFVPIATVVCTPFPGETLEQNIQICREVIDLYDKLTLTIDGENRNNLIERRAQSRGFPAWFPEDNLFDVPEDVPAGVYIMVAEGQFALIEGLPEGEHVIHTRASSTTDASAPPFDVTFKIRIMAPTGVVFR
jgi:hypothetical protein